MEEFVSAFESVLSDKKHHVDLPQLFMKIDVNCDGNTP